MHKCKCACQCLASLFRLVFSHPLSFHFVSLLFLSQLTSSFCNCLLLLEDGHKVQYSGFIYSRFWTMGKTQCVSDNRARLIWVLHIDLWEVLLTGDGWPFSNFSFLNSLLQLYYCLFEDWLNLFIWSFAQTVLPREQMRRDKMRKKTRWAKKSRKPRQYTKRRG